MKQPDLFSESFSAPDFKKPTARASDPPTSHAAAVDATVRASPGRLLALAALKKWGPLTDFGLAHCTGWQQTSIGKRRGELEDAGLVKALMFQGVRMTRPAPSGSQAQVWCITDAGLRFLASH